VDRLLDAPPKALPLRLEELLGTLRLPTRSPPADPVRLEPKFPEPGDVRFAPVLPARLAPVDGCVRPVVPEF